MTLIGPGGVGKTRLLGESGLRLRAARPERAVVMCELAAASEESAVDVVAAALGIDGRPGVGLAERVATVLADSEIVLLLDNCEHVLDPIADLVERLARHVPGRDGRRDQQGAAAGTRRAAVRCPGAARPAPTTPPPSSCSSSGPAPWPRVSIRIEPSWAVISEIVRRLDGLPLAIELAAARLHTLDVTEVAAGLDHRFRLLSSGYRTSSRHGSLHAAISWSLGLLDAGLQRTFADLSVFAGSVHGERRGGDLRCRRPPSRSPSTSWSNARS